MLISSATPVPAVVRPSNRLVASEVLIVGVTPPELVIGPVALTDVTGAVPLLAAVSRPAASTVTDAFVYEPAVTAVAGSLVALSVPLVMLLAFVVSVVALVASPETAALLIAMLVLAAAVRRPLASTVNVPTADALP
jgi:hypothetical protein